MPGSYTSQPSRKFVAGENLASYRVVTGTTAAAVILADYTTSPPIGTTGIDGGVSSGENVDVLLMNAPGTRLLTAGAAITAGDPLAVTTDGKVIAAPPEEYIFGVALEAAAGANAVIEVLPIQGSFYAPKGS
jgi:hypothetical protein